MVQEYESGAEAEEVALALSSRRSGVALYQVEVDTAGMWSEPDVLATYGDVPAVDFQSPP